jgi:hypothetical protein
MMKVARIFAAILSFAIVGTSLAQTPIRRWGGHFGGGWTMPLNETADKVDSGWHLMGGALYHVNDRLSLRFDLEYDTMDASSETLEELAVPDGYTEIWSGMGGVQLRLNPNGKVRLYLFGSVGAHNKRAVFTEPTLEPVVICDPWWGYCYETIVEVDTVLGERDETSFGVNGGVGVAMSMRNGTSLFLETKYQWIDGDRAVEYVPVTIGFRW